MEDFRHSRGGPAAALSGKIPNGAAKSAYDEVFGGQLRYSGHFPPRVTDYGEIFGGLEDSCSIPFLDLPEEIDGGCEVVRGSDFDYYEIFGGFGSRNLDVCYEDLFVSSSNGRESKETVSKQQAAAISRFHSEGPNKDHVSWPEKDKTSLGGATVLLRKDHLVSNETNHGKGGSKQFDMSYNISSQGSREVAGNGNAEGANPPILEHNGNIASAESKGTITEEKHFQKIVLPFPSFSSMKIHGNEMKDDQKQFDANTAFENASTDELCNSCFSSNPSTPSGGRPISDHTTSNSSLNADYNSRIMEEIQCRKTVPPFPCISMKYSGNELKAEQKQSSLEFTSSHDTLENKKCHPHSSKNHLASNGSIPFPDYSTSDLTSDLNSVRDTPEVKQFTEILSPTLSFKSAESFGDNENADQEKLTSTSTYLEEPPAIEEHGSHSCSYHSGSSRDRCYPGCMFLTTSDINLQTQSSQLAPPARTPPKLARHRHPKIMMATDAKSNLDEKNLYSRMGNHQRTDSGGAFGSNLCKESAKNNSPHPFDVGVDASSVAAASAAAIKDAIEQAQARLKSAKEAMERKKNNFSKNQKMDFNDALQCKDKKKDNRTEEAHRYPEEILEEIYEEKLNSFKAASNEEKNNKSMKEVGFTQELEERGRHLELTEESLQANQRKVLRPTHVLGEKGEQKLEKQFYDLVSNEKKFQMLEEISQQDICKKKSEETIKVNEKDQIEKKSDSEAPEQMYQNLAVNEFHEPEDRYCDMKEANVMDGGDKIKEMSKVSLLASLHEKNMNSLKEASGDFNSLKEALGDFHRENDEIELEVPDFHTVMEEKNMSTFDEVYLCKGSITKVQAANEDCESWEVGATEEEKKSRASVEETYNSDREVGVNKFNMDNRAFEVDGNGIDVLMNQMLCEEGLELRGAQEISEEDDVGRTIGFAKAAYCREERETKLAEARVVVEQEEHKKFDAKHENSKWVENEKKAKVGQEPYHQRESAEDINGVQEALGYNEIEMNMEEEIEACRRDSEDKLLKETWEEIRQNVENQKVDSAASDQDAIEENSKWVENEKKLKVAQERYHQESAKDMNGVQEVLGYNKNEKKMEEETEAFQRVSEGKLPKETCEEIQRNVEKQMVTLAPCELGNFEYKVMAYQGDVEKVKVENIKEVKVPLNSLESNSMSRDTQEIHKSTDKEKELEDIKEAHMLEEITNILKIAQEAVESQDTEGTDCKIPDIHRTEEQREEERTEQRIEEMESVRNLEEEKEMQGERETKRAQESAEVQDTEGIDHKIKIADIYNPEEKIEEERTGRQRKPEIERARKFEEEKDRERDREREKDRQAVERATHEACERALAEARERAERVAVERVTYEARQRALAEAREKAEKASAEALEKSKAEKASREARLRAERAAVERATSEARERALERAIAEKAAQGARERAARSTTTSKDRQRKDNAGEVRAGAKEDGGTRKNSSIPDMRDNVQTSQFPSYFYSNGKTGGSDGESVMRCKARSERHERTVGRAAKALAEKNMRDILAQREQAERDRLAETLNADVKRWSNGKEGNLRALLSTLQYILGADSGWQPIQLTDIITAAAVKKSYRKATLCVHPDKLQQRGASIQQKYVCEKVFDLLKEAWNRFNSEER